MKVRYFNITLLNVFLVVTLSVSVYGSVYNTFYGQASPICAETPKVVLQSGTAGTSTIYTNNTSAKVSVVAPRNWWNLDYDYRRQISIINNVASTLGSGYSVCLIVDTASLVSGGKTLPSGNDLRIVYLNGSSWVEIDRDVIDMNTSSTKVWFKTQADISASGSDNNYYMYYGNPSAVNPPADKSNVYDFWDDFDDASLDPAWTFSQIGGASGSYYESGTVVILNATTSGDLWDTSDNFLFLSISRSYNVLVESYTYGWGGSHNTWSKMGGVQLRQSLAANSKNRIMSPVYSAVGATNSYRLPTGGSTFEQTTATQSRYCRLSRIGGASRAWYSTDGVSWTELGSQISFSGGLSSPVRLGTHLAGLSSSSHWVEVDWFKVRKYVEPEPSASVGSEVTNWLTGWTYRKSHVINYVAGAGTNYQVKVKVHYGSGIDSGENVYLNGKCRTDFGDTRFTSGNGITLLDYWMESKVDSDNAIFWVEVADDLSTINRTIYIYYGKTDATTASNGTNTFIYFDDFSGDLSKWTTIAGTWGISGGKLYCSAGTGRLGMYITGSSLSNAAIDYVGTTPISDDNAHGPGAYYRGNGALSGGDVFIRGYWHLSNNRWEIKADTTFIATNAANSPEGTTKLHSMRFYGTSHKMYADDVLVVSGTSALGTSPGKVGVTLYYTVSGVPSGIYWDDYRVRKYVDSEPAHGNWGSEETYPYVLKIVNQASNAWKISLEVYSSSNIGRLSNATIRFHDGTTSDQIIISGGVITQSEGPQYDLPGVATRYISIVNLSESTSGTSYLYVYLKILIPDTTTYSLYIITFEIT